jgi:uncharacterized protein (TIGR03067 family)
MRLRFLMAVIAVGLAAGASSAAADADDKQRLQGVWTAVSAERNGGAAEDLTGHQLTVSGDRFTIRSKGKLLYQGTFRVGPSRKPATIDFTHTRGEAKGKAWLGVYRLEGDVLKICDNADDLAQGRPAAFATEPGSGRVLVTFRRERG